MDVACKRPFVPFSCGDVNTSPRGIFTSARQFSNFVSFAGLFKGARAIFILVIFLPRPVIVTKSPVSSALIRHVCIFSYKDGFNVFTFIVSLNISW